MKKANTPGKPQGVEPADAKGRSHNEVVDTVPPSKPQEPPTHPALRCFDINRKLNKLEESYGRDQKEKPVEIESSSAANPRSAAISWKVKRLLQYVEEIKSAYEKEIEAGRFADTPDLWAAVYAVKILPSVSAKINSLIGNLAHRLWLTGGGGPGERASFEEAQRELSRLRARIEHELANTASQAEEVTEENHPRPRMKPKMKSDLRMAIRACWALKPELTYVDKGTRDWLQQNNPTVVPASWEHDDSLPGKTFTKVRKLIKDETLSTATTRHDPPIICRKLFRSK